jgi:hypothetical protein
MGDKNTLFHGDEINKLALVKNFKGTVQHEIFDPPFFSSIKPT